MRALLYRHLQIAFALFVALLLIALGMLAGLSWRNQQRLDLIARSVEHTHALQRAGLDMRHLQVADLTGLVPLREESLNALAQTIAALARPGVLLVPDNPLRLQQAKGLLEGWDAPAAGAPRRGLGAPAPDLLCGDRQRLAPAGVHGP